jgi:hypothetical protein
MVVSANWLPYRSKHHRKFSWALPEAALPLVLVLAVVVAAAAV